MKEIVRHMNTKIWVAVPTPFHEDGSLDLEGIAFNTKEYAARGINGIFCNGLFGENWALGEEERALVARTIRDAAEGKLEICAVATMGTEEETVRMGRIYKEMGIDYACLITPKKALPDEELIGQFGRLMEAIDMPFVIFNSVTPEGVSVLTPAAFAEISKNENVKILKTTVSDEVNNALRRAAREGVLVSDPTEEKFFRNATENGQRILFADPEPFLYQTQTFQPIRTYISLIEKGEVGRAKEIFDALAPLRVQYNKWFLKAFYEGTMTMAYLKVFAEVTGLVGGAVRAPLTPVPAEEREQMSREILDAFQQVHAVLGESLLPEE